jgi:raffinose/stachyose/melibiose transport system permease protein
MIHVGAGKRLQILFYLIVVVTLFLQIYPLCWVIFSSLKDASELAGKSAFALPSRLYLGNYLTALLKSKIPNYYINSIVIAAGTLLGIIGLGAPASFAISKIQFRHNEKVLTFFLAGIMVPAFACLIPMFQIYNKIGLRNTYWALMLPQIGFSLPMCIYLYTGYMRFIPNSLYEAAIIDGASNLQIFLKIFFPMIKNSTLTIVIFNFMGIWNEFMFANTFLTDTSMRTLPVGLNDFIGDYGRVDWGSTYAAIVLAILPTLIVYFFLNKYIMTGMAAGAIKE